MVNNCHVHSESDAEPISEVVVKRGRGGLRKEKPPKYKHKRGRPKQIWEPKDKKPIGRPRKIREPKKKRPPGRPKQWKEEDIAGRPKCKPKDPEHFNKYCINVVKPRLEARQAAELDGHISLPLLTV